MSGRVQRKLAAIVAVDVVGYSRLMDADETGTISALRKLRFRVIDPLIEENGGRIVKIMGDGLLLEFPSVVAAVDFAITTQEKNIRRNESAVAETAMRLRIGVHIGDVVIDGNDLLGGGVNIAARIEPLAKPDGVSVSDDAYQQVRDRMKIAWEDGGAHAVKNIARPIQIWHWAGVGQQATEQSIANKAAPKTPAKPSVAVLPFDNLSGDPDQSYFSDGITDDIITELSKYDELFVVSRHSSFSFRRSTMSTETIARELGVQYIAAGSVRRAGQRVRVTARLIDPFAGTDLWSERYDRNIRDIFELQDEISSVIVNTLVGAIVRQQHSRALQKSEETVNAYDHFLRAIELNYLMEPAKAQEARAEAEKALVRDPNFARAHALVAWTYISEASNAWATDTRKALDSAKEAALAGVAANNREPFAHAVLGWVYMWSDQAYERGLEEQHRAVQTNPGNAQFRSMLAFSMTYAGQSSEALVALDEVMRLNPYYPELFHVFYGRALFNLHRYEEAMPKLELIRTSQPYHANALAHAAACYAALGRTRDARTTIEEVRRASAGYTLSHAREFVAYADPVEKSHFLEYLALAGLT